MRRVIGDTKCRMIKTHRGVGHRFTVPVVKVDGTASQAQTDQQAHVHTAMTSAMTPEKILCEPSSGSPAPRPAHVVDRCVNLLLGVAIGDAFGAGYASLAPAEVAQRFNFARYNKCPHPKSKHRPGCYTDDTQMSLAVAKTLYAERFTKDTLAHAFHKAYRCDKRPGYSSRTLQALEQPTVAEFIRWADRSGTIGTAMRAVPLGVLPDVETVVAYACINGDTPPRKKEAIAASVAVALASHYFFNDCGPAGNVFTYCQEHMPKHLQVESFISLCALLSTRTTLDAECLQTLGWDSHRGLDITAVKMASAAIFLAAHATDPTEVLRKSVHMGGKATDTIASLALGPLCGTRLSGVTAIVLVRSSGKRSFGPTIS